MPDNATLVPETVPLALVASTPAAVSVTGPTTPPFRDALSVTSLPAVTITPDLPVTAPPINAVPAVVSDTFPVSPVT